MSVSDRLIEAFVAFGHRRITYLTRQRLIAERLDRAMHNIMDSLFLNRELLLEPEVNKFVVGLMGNFRELNIAVMEWIELNGLEEESMKNFQADLDGALEGR